MQEKNSFCPRASALRDSWGSLRTLHTFANRTSRPTNRNLQKSAIFHPTKKLEPMPLKEIILKGEQKRVLFLPAIEPIQIKGVAGSGKTTVALYRAKHLIETQNNLFKETKVAIFTFNKTLTNYIEAIKHNISGGYQKDSEEITPRSAPGLNVQVVNFHKWAYWFLRNRGIEAFIDFRNFPTFQSSSIEKHRKVLLTKHPDNNVLNKRVEFFIEEFKWIKGKLLLAKNDYMNAPRTGRGTSDRVTQIDREHIWSVFESYNQDLKNAGKIDFDDYAILCLKEIENDTSFEAPFTHIIVDEAQDLSKAQILTISKIVSPETKSLSIIADTAQRIYKSGFSWKEVGIEVRGNRTLSLKKNYRNTEAISLAATSLLNHDPDPSEFTIAEPARKGGEKPEISFCSDWNNEKQYILEKLKQIDLKNELTVLLHRDWNGMRKLKDLLFYNKIGCEIINENSAINFDNGMVKICTLSSVKGLEFDNVFITEVNEDNIPYPPGFNDENDDIHISTERRLLYTAMTRAREKLYLSLNGTPSRYINEIDREYVQIIKL